MAELVSQQSTSTIYRLACELGAYRLREALADKPFIEYDSSLRALLLRCLPDEVASIAVCSAVDGSRALLHRDAVSGPGSVSYTHLTLPTKRIV